jgi:hypothetical protein
VPLYNTGEIEKEAELSFIGIIVDKKAPFQN